jgi:hypothetical protein
MSHIGEVERANTRDRPEVLLPAEFDDRHERELIGELLDLCGFNGLQHVVDYGCGRGRWIWPLFARCQYVTGLIASRATSTPSLRSPPPMTSKQCA